MLSIHIENDLSGFESAQDLAYRATSTVMGMLNEGMSEKEAAAMLETFCRDFGVKSFFHKPFAWFGDRTRYQDFKSNFDFLPSKRRLINGDVVILDVAPILNGHVADVGHTFVFGNSNNPEHKKARDLLLSLRKSIPVMFESQMSTSDIWAKVESEMLSAGFENIYKMYPFEVLGHRVHKVPFGEISGLIAPFGWHSVYSLLSHGLLPDLLGPKHKGSKTGIWAIEPHLGGKGFGAKFEELLVVEEPSKGQIKARWISDDVPHLKKGWFVL